MKVKKLKQDEMISWLRLARSTTELEFFNLLALHGTVEGALQSLSDDVYSISEAEQELQKTQEVGARIVPSCDPEFPNSLQGIAPIITVLGNTLLLHSESVAIIGNHNSSEEAKKFSKELADKLIKANFVIISNLDEIISPVVIVTTSSIDTTLPSTDEVDKNGRLIVTASPPFMQLKPQHFFQKNNIISGLSLGVIVTEASRDSESLITVSYALQHNKEVFIVPGNPWDPNYAGSNNLIKNGARLIESADDVIEILRNK